MSCSAFPLLTLLSNSSSAVCAIQAVIDLPVTLDVLGMNGKNIRNKILIGRPEHHFGYPNAIFNHPLAILHYKLNVLDNHEAHSEMEFLDVSNKFLTNMLADYPDENSRWEACHKFFTDILGKGKEQMPPAQSASHSFWSTVPSFKRSPTSPLQAFPCVILEVKREKGCGQPMLQCVKYYAEICSKWVVRNALYYTNLLNSTKPLSHSEGQKAAYPNYVSSDPDWSEWA
jgi:hypothetical protein